MDAKTIFINQIISYICSYFIKSFENLKILNQRYSLIRLIYESKEARKSRQEPAGGNKSESRMESLGSK
jgi:hypothetical protein